MGHQKPSLVHRQHDRLNDKEKGREAEEEMWDRDDNRQQLERQR